MVSLATRFLVGAMSSLIVFVPTTIISTIFRRVRPRDFLGFTADQVSSADLKVMNIKVRAGNMPRTRATRTYGQRGGNRERDCKPRQSPCETKKKTGRGGGPLCWARLQEDYLERRNWMQRTFLDWHVPWWVNPVLYAIIGAGWVVSMYFTLLYGVTFTYDQVCSERFEVAALGRVNRADCGLGARTLCTRLSRFAGSGVAVVLWHLGALLRRRAAVLHRHGRRLAGHGRQHCRGRLCHRRPGRRCRAHVLLRQLALLHSQLPYSKSRRVPAVCARSFTGID